MGFLNNPFTKNARPPPPEWQHTKPKRPEHVEHATPSPGSEQEVGFGDGSVGIEQRPAYERYQTGLAQDEVNEDMVQVEGEDKMSKFSYLLACAAGLSGFLFGYDTGVISGALVNLGSDLGHELNAQEKEWAASATSVGALVGALMAGWACDRFGRKATLAIGDVWFTVGAVLIAASYSYPQLVVGRLVLGFGVGTAAMVAPVYIGELAPSHLRGRLVTIQSLMITGGQVISYALGAGFTFNGGWRALFAVSILPAAIQAILVHWLPESPRYDLLKGRVDHAHKTLSIVYPEAEPHEIDLKIHVMLANVRQVQAFQSKTPFIKLPVLLFSKGPYRRATIAAAGLMFFQQFAGFNTLLYYAPTLFGFAGFDNPTATGIIVAATNLVFTAVGMFTMDRVGKRRLLLLMIPFQVLGLALVAVAFAKMTEPSGGVLAAEFASLYEAKWTNMMIGMIVVYVAAYATALGNIPWHMAELFPLEIRGYGTSFGTAICWASNIVVSATFLTMLENIGAPATFGFYAGMCAAGLLFVSFCYPETRLLTLEDCSKLFLKDFGIKESNRMRAQKRQLAIDRKDMVEKEISQNSPDPKK